MRSTSSAAGAVECAVCDAGFYLEALDLPASGDNCVPCVEAAECPWNTTLETLVDLLPGLEGFRISEVVPHTLKIQRRDRARTVALQT